MLAKKKRITKELFQVIMKNGRVIHSPLFTFRYIKHDPGYAFAVPKAVSKRAVDRNSLRRKGYNTLRTCSLKPVAGVFLYKKMAEKPSALYIKENIVFILDKITF